MVRAAQHLRAAPRAGQDLHRAVAADVGERAQLAVVAAHDRNRLAGHVGGRERAGLGHHALGADEDPGAREDAVHLRVEGRLLHVGAGGQGDALLVGDAHALELRGDRLPHERAGARAADAAEQRLLREPVHERAQPRSAGPVVGAAAGAHVGRDLLDPGAVALLDVRPQGGLVQRGAQHLGPDAPVLLDGLLVHEVREHGRLEPLARRLAAGDGRLDEGVDLLVGIQERAAQELRARVEVVVHEGARDACGARHVAHAHAVAAALGDHTARGTEDIVGAVGDSHLTDSLVKRIRTAVSRRRHPARATSESFRRLPP